MKKAVFLITLLVFGSLVLGQIRQWSDGNDVVYHVNVLNGGESNAHDLALTVYIPDLSLFKRINRFDLGSGDNTAKIVFDSQPKPGIYLTRITLSNSENGILDSKYIYTII